MKALNKETAAKTQRPKWGWGFKNYQAEANKGGGLKVPDWVRVYLSYILPLLLLVLIVQGLIG